MATDSRSIDVQKLVSGAAKLEMKLLTSGVEAMQVYLNRASQFSDLAAQTLQAVQDDRATLADTVRKVSVFGRESVQAYADLAQRLGTRYFDELDRLANSTPVTETPPSEVVPTQRRRTGGRKR